ncbi:MAG: DNA alkylation repair protein [Erysipelothrix sp.]|jgi:3-methyladenine DNA glycosylase AlkD|nr:DNA alkylation repair protein [Erysipelothrix sp.]
MSSDSKGKTMDAYQDFINWFNLTTTDLKHNESSRKPFFGISYPRLKEYSKVIIKGSLYDFLNSNQFVVYELEIIQTYLIGSIKDINLALHYFESFAPHAKEWSVVDSLTQRFVIAKKHPSEVFKLIETYAAIDDEFYQRIAAVLLLSHYLNDETIDQSIDILISLKHQGYYTKMAVAWAFTSIMCKYPSKCLVVLNEHHLDPWTHNKAISKMIDSFQIDEQHKLHLKELRRK